MTVSIVKRLFTVDEYHEMGRTGILGEGDRVELIDGEIVQMSSIGRRHAACVNRLTHMFVSRLGLSAVVSIRNPVHLGQHSEPEPDVALLRPRSDFYASGHPGRTDILLIVEVAETSVDFDREVKIPRYAKAGIPEVWLVDLSADAIETHRSPTAGAYEQVQTVSGTERLVPLAFPHLDLSANEVLA